ncbi:MAG: metallophosphoesterase [Pseudomonadota bacterium]
MDRVYRLAHLSDPHLAPPALPIELSKRALSALSWRMKRRHRHLSWVVEALTTDLLQQAPDHIAVTGDLTNFGTEAEFRAGADWLGGLGRPEAVSFVPGNHDAMVASAWPRGQAVLAPYCTGDDGAMGMPWLRRRGGLALIGVSSAVATVPFSAAGALGPAQVDRVWALLRQTREEGLCRVLLIHHPPGEGVIARKALRDRAALCAVMAREGTELVLHGHLHRAALGSVLGPDGPIPLIGAPSASMRPRGHEDAGAWRMLAISRAATGWRMTLVERGLDASRAVVERARFEIVL